MDQKDLRSFIPEPILKDEEQFNSPVKVFYVKGMKLIPEDRTFHLGMQGTTPRGKEKPKEWIHRHVFYLKIDLLSFFERIKKKSTR